MSYEIIGAKYGNVSGESVILQTADMGAVVVSEQDRPELWAKLQQWIATGNTPEPADTPSAAEVAALAAGKSLDAAIGADTTLAQLKAMTNAEFDAWWAANVTTAAQAIGVLKRLAKLAIRRLL